MDVADWLRTLGLEQYAPQLSSTINLVAGLAK